MPYGKIGYMNNNNHKNYDYTRWLISLVVDTTASSTNYIYTFYFQS